MVFASTTRKDNKCIVVIATNSVGGGEVGRVFVARAVAQRGLQMRLGEKMLLFFSPLSSGKTK